MIHGKPGPEAETTYCNLALAGLVSLLFPSPDAPETILVVYCDEAVPLAEQSLCPACEEAAAGLDSNR